MTEPPSIAPVDLEQLAEDLLERARGEKSGRAGRTLPHPVDGLRQTVIALTAGTSLDEHESPGSASLLVLRGRARLAAGGNVTSLGTHEIAPIPDMRHSLHVEEDAVVLLSVAHSHSTGH